MLLRISYRSHRNIQLRLFSGWKLFASVDPDQLSGHQAHRVLNLGKNHPCLRCTISSSAIIHIRVVFYACLLVNGQWKESKTSSVFVDPLNGEPFLQVPDTDAAGEIDEFIKSLKKCSKSGLHNPLKNPERYVMYGDISAKVAQHLRQPEVLEFFARLIQRVAPKSRLQAIAEVEVTRKFFENFSGDQVRFLARSFGVSGDHAGQTSHGMRWPYGPVTIISPFNFPMEIPMLQLMGALYMGNKVLLKCDSKVAVVMEQALRLLHHCGMPLQDVDFINCDGSIMHKLLVAAQPRMTQFTGSSRVAEILCKDLNGKIRIEDAGFDWKVLGPDVDPQAVAYVAYQCDQDAYAFSGQKCSAQSILFVHENWQKIGFVKQLQNLAATRKLSDLTIGPVLSVTNQRFLDHVSKLLKIPGAKVLFGGDLHEQHSIPAIYGSFKPTAVEVPLEEFLKPGIFELCNTEIFGPFQVSATLSSAI
jgi:1-pyrroline-5-carboxylate dehydrogenase